MKRVRVKKGKIKMFLKWYIIINLLFLVFKPQIPFAQYDSVVWLSRTTIMNWSYFATERKYGKAVANALRRRDRYAAGVRNNVRRVQGTVEIIGKVFGA